MSLSLPDVFAPVAIGHPTGLRHLPEATFTPTVAGLRPEGEGNQLNFQSMLSDALAKILAAGLQQGALPPQPPPIAQTALPDRPLATAAASSSQPAHASSEGSDEEDHYPEDVEFSEDEGQPPEKPVFTGLFRPSVFKSLLNKAKMTTKFGDPEVTPGCTSHS